MVETILNISAQAFVIMIIGGFLAKKTDLLSKETLGHLSTLLISVFLPASMVASSQQEFSVEMSISLLQMAALTAAYYLITIIVMKQVVKPLKMSEERKRILLCLVTFANVSFIGFPIVEMTVGESGVLIALILNIGFQLVFFSFGNWYLQGNGTISLKAIFSNFTIKASIFSVILYFIPFRFPSWFMAPFSALGNLVMPVSMLVIGAQIVNTGLAKIKPTKDTMIPCIIRMIIIPVIIFLLLQVLPVDDEVKQVMFILSSLPPATMNAILATQHHCDPEYAVIVTAQTMVMMLVQLPIVIWVINYFW